MASKAQYRYLEPRSDKSTKELFLRDTGIRASTLWHDRYISRQNLARIAEDRDIPLGAVYESLDYCQEAWELICQENDEERQWLDQTGFFDDPSNRG